ncbi:hypothetical protein [Helicobacter bilis]|uniref:hypothetical protein n=1 Tax=Helicobacter bilis TaxID=37372 RepID=UPI0012DAF938|nr:hypothetical protein [Helicobacter bilis]
MVDIANDITSRIDSTLSSINTKTGNTTQKSIIYVGGTELPRGAKSVLKILIKHGDL